MGKSIGSGPAIHLASKYEPGILVTISAYKSVESLIREKISILSNFFTIGNHFNNAEAIKNVGKGGRTKVLLIHGKLDDLIPSEHSIYLS